MKKFLASTARRRNGGFGGATRGNRRNRNFNAANSFMSSSNRPSDAGAEYNMNQRQSERPFMFGPDAMRQIEEMPQEAPPTHENANKDTADGNKDKKRDRLLTQMETYNMKHPRGDPTPFLVMPRVSRARQFDDDDAGPWGNKAGGRDDMGDRGDGAIPPPVDDEMGGDGKGDEHGRHHRRKRKSPDEDDEQGFGDARPKPDLESGPESGGKTKFRRNVPPYYKIFELNSRFFLSGLGMITLCNIIFALIAVITGVESDPVIQYRFPEPHVHLAMLAIVLSILLLKYSAYLFHMRNLNRRMEIAHILFFLVILITTGFYAHWLLNKLPENVHNAYDVRLPCAHGGSMLDKDQPAPVGQEQNLKIDEETKETAIKNWYVCALIRHTYDSGIACIVFSCLLLCGLIANVIHAFMGIQNGVDITS